jgi:hypothetical protein
MFSKKCLDRHPDEGTQLMRAAAHYKTQQTERCTQWAASMSAEEKNLIRSMRGILEFGRLAESDVELLTELANSLPYEAAIMKATAAMVVFFMDKKCVAVDWTDTALPCDPKEFARLLKFIVESEDHPFELVFNLPKDHWFNGKVVEAEFNALLKYGTGDALVTYDNAVLSVAKTVGSGRMTVHQANFPALPDITTCLIGNMHNAILFGIFLSTQKSVQSIKCSPDFLAALNRSLVRCVVEGVYKDKTAAGMVYSVVGQELRIEPSAGTGLTFFKQVSPLYPTSTEISPCQIKSTKEEHTLTDKKNLKGATCGRCGVVSKEGRTQCFRCKAVLKH